MNLRNKNYLLLVLFLGLLSFSFGQVNKVDDKGRKQGKWVKYFANSSDVRYQGEFKDNQPMGTFIYYYPSGKVRAVIKHSLKSNRKVASYYHENDSLASYGIYRGELKDSTWINFLDTGWPMSKENYKNGELNGERVIYYGPEVSEDSKTAYILRRENYKDGRLDGTFKEYFHDGVLKTEGMYVNGQPEGLIKKYNPNGKIMMEERWKNRLKHGWWMSYDENGKENGRKYYYNGEELEGDKLEKHLKLLKEKGINPNK